MFLNVWDLSWGLTKQPRKPVQFVKDFRMKAFVLQLFPGFCLTVLQSACVWQSQAYKERRECFCFCLRFLFFFFQMEAMFLVHGRNSPQILGVYKQLQLECRMNSRYLVYKLLEYLVQPDGGYESLFTSNSHTWPSQSRSWFVCVSVHACVRFSFPLNSTLTRDSSYFPSLFYFPLSRVFLNFSPPGCGQQGPREMNYRTIHRRSLAPSLCSKCIWKHVRRADSGSFSWYLFMLLYLNFFPPLNGIKIC